MNTDQMTKSEREELSRLVRAQARVAKAGLEQRAAELLADVERQLASRYKIDHAAWNDLTAAAQRAVKQADAEIAARCRELGIPEEFRPGLNLLWYSRGENAFSERRVELRKVAQTRIAAAAKGAQVAIEAAMVQRLTILAAGALTSAQAKDFLASMPTVQELMPVLDVTALGPLALPMRSVPSLTAPPEEG